MQELKHFARWTQSKFSLHVYRNMPPNHWFERHICGTNGAVAQLCQNSPQKSCCAVVRDYWTGHLYMHIQQCVWYPSRLLWPLAFKAALHCLVCNPHRLSFRASSVEAEVWWGKREGEERERGRDGERKLEGSRRTGEGEERNKTEGLIEGRRENSKGCWENTIKQKAGKIREGRREQRTWTPAVSALFSSLGEKTERLQVVVVFWHFPSFSDKNN